VPILDQQINNVSLYRLRVPLKTQFQQNTTDLAKPARLFEYNATAGHRAGDIATVVDTDCADRVLQQVGVRTVRCHLQQHSRLYSEARRCHGYSIRLRNQQVAGSTSGHSVLVLLESCSKRTHIFFSFECKYYYYYYDCRD